MKGHKRQKAKVCRLLRRGREGRGGGSEAIPCFEEVLGELGFGEGGVIDLDAFADRAEVGGREEADFAEGGGWVR